MSQNTPHLHTRRRVEFIDALRGLAVIFMILWHTADGWLTDEARAGAGWTAIRLMGGLAAPLFVFLAGVGSGLAIGARHGRDRDKISSRIFWRGLQIVVLGYLLRLQFWALDSLALFKLGSFWICLLIFCGWMSVLYAIGLFPYRWLPKRWRTPHRGVALLGLTAAAVGYTFIHLQYPGRLKGLLRVDVLHCIGVSVALVAWLWRKRDRAVMSLAVALTFALLTHAMRATMPAGLPPFVAAYLALFDAPGGTWTLFPLFPWASYAFAGAATGLAWKTNEQKVSRLGLRLMLATLVGLASYEGFAHVHHWMQATPEGVQPLRVVYRMAWIFGLSAVVQALFTFAPKLRLEPIITLGQTSLLIYWVHLEFAYGISARIFRKQLIVTQWLLGLSFVLLLSYIVAKIRVRKKVAQQTKLTSSKT